MTEGGGPEYARRAARVLLLDGAGRVLLLRCAEEAGNPDLGHLWVAPGGGVGDGESLAEAAARELHEEVGLLVAPGTLGRPVAFTCGYPDLSRTAGLFRDDYFWHRVHGHHVDTSRMEAPELGSHLGHRWWSIDELAVTDELVYPVGLAGLLADLLAGRVPEPPVQLPWQH